MRISFFEKLEGRWYLQLYWYTYVFNNPLRFVDPSGYYNKPSPHEREQINGEGIYFNYEAYYKLSNQRANPGFMGGQSFWMEGPEGGYMVTPGVDYFLLYSGDSINPSNYSEPLGNGDEAVINSSFSTDFRIGSLTYILDGVKSVSGNSIVIDGVPFHFYYGNEDPVDLSGNYFHSALISAMFSAKRGQSLEDIIYMNTLDRHFMMDRYNPWSEPTYITKKKNTWAAIDINTQSSRTEFRNLKLITKNKTLTAYKGMDLALIPRIEAMPFSNINGAYPYKFSAQFIVYDKSGNNSALLNLINVRFHGYQLLMDFLNIYAK